MATVKDTLAQNEYVEIDIPTDTSCDAAVRTSAGSVELRGTVDGVNYDVIGLGPSAGGAVVLALAAAGSATAFVGGFEKIRAIKTTAGNADVALSITHR